MPQRPPTVCSHPGCRNTANGRYCPSHVQNNFDIQRRRDYDKRRGTMWQRGYKTAWRKLRMLVLRTHPLCQDYFKIGCRKPATDVDHIVPRNKGGQDTLDNLQALCHACHSRKTALEDGGFGHEANSGVQR